MIADLKPYAEYKESGSKWLEEGSWGSDMTIDLLETVAFLAAIASVH